MDAKETIRRFKNHLRSSGYSDKTIGAYTRNLDKFAGYLKTRRITDLRRVTVDVMHDYRSFVMSKPGAPESKALTLRPVKRLFEHLTASHQLFVNPAEGLVETCRKNRRTGPVLTREEIRSLMDAPDLSSGIQFRNRAVMELMYAAGIRLDELLHLEIDDADLTDGVVTVRKGKGKKDRTLPLGKTASGYLKQYITEIRPCHARQNPGVRYLFLNIGGHPLKAGSLQGIIRQYGIKAGIERPVSPHTLRRTCATHMAQNGADVRYISELLGHKRLSTTQSYVRVMTKEVKDVHRKTHPNNLDPDNQDQDNPDRNALDQDNPDQNNQEDNDED